MLPLDFIPLAEESGLIIPLGEWVLREAIRQCKEWQNAGLPYVRMAVNISAEQFKLSNMTNLVRKILNEAKLDPEYLEIEITESVLISNTDVIRVINELKKMGVKIALDDFGTGYSSLGYLKKLPLDKLKIDKTFIDSITNSDGESAISKAIISIGKNLKLDILAEGVETKNQANFLMQHHCDAVQGFYFSKPLTSKELETLLRTCPDIELSQVTSPT